VRFFIINGLVLNITNLKTAPPYISQIFQFKKWLFPRGGEVDQFDFTKRAPVSVDTSATFYNRDYVYNDIK